MPIITDKVNVIDKLIKDICYLEIDMTAIEKNIEEHQGEISDPEALRLEKSLSDIKEKIESLFDELSKEEKKIIKRKNAIEKKKSEIKSIEDNIVKCKSDITSVVRRLNENGIKNFGTLKIFTKETGKVEYKILDKKDIPDRYFKRKVIIETSYDSDQSILDGILIELDPGEDMMITDETKLDEKSLKNNVTKSDLKTHGHQEGKVMKLRKNGCEYSFEERITINTSKIKLKNKK